MLAAESLSWMAAAHANSHLFWAFLLAAAVFVFFRSAVSADDTDRLSLLAFKDAITSDPSRVLSSWNDSVHFCNWTGVVCALPTRVTRLDLPSLNLSGTLSPSLGNLTFLDAIQLQGNSFFGSIPPEVGNLSRLQNLSLRGNSLSGEIPPALVRCSKLLRLDLMINALVGRIPDDIGLLPHLRFLYLSSNNLTGPIPRSLGNLSSLEALSLARNNLQGSIPSELGRIPNISLIQISQNTLSGTIPSSIYNLSTLFFLSVTGNFLGGIIPPDLGLRLPNLQYLFMARNLFTGPIPVSLPNASNLQEVYFTNNDFTGPAPRNLGTLKSLSVLSLGGNMLGTGEPDDLEFITPLTNCTLLTEFTIHENWFGGVLPSSIANLSTQLDRLGLGLNRITGTIPSGIVNLVNLTVLSLNENLLEGVIPLDFGKLSKLQMLLLSGSGLYGPIPSSMGNMTVLNILDMDRNDLEGSIPPTLGKCQNLAELSLFQNKLNGTIPKEILTISSLSTLLSLAQNSLTGPLPSEVGLLQNLGQLDVSSNMLSGEIPVSISGCVTLEVLNMSGNQFRGTIPPLLSDLKGLRVLDLSDNNFSGPIPEYVGNFPSVQSLQILDLSENYFSGQIPSALGKFSSLLKLNLSFNNLEGEVPQVGVFTNASAISIAGNKELCGGISLLRLPSCAVLTSEKRKLLPIDIVALIVVVSAASALLCIATLFCFRRRSKAEQPAAISRSLNVSYSELTRANLEDRFLALTYTDLLEATDGFSAANLIGTGACGFVYKGRLDKDETVAVKVLNLEKQGAAKSFIAECAALKGIRHRNLVKILTSCSSMDYNGKDFQALVLEYMPNGSLEEWLHPSENKQARIFNFSQRLNAAIDIASALEYLHHYLQTPIVHCDIKPSNVLLDEDMTARVADFGLAKVLHEITGNSAANHTNSVAIRGSIGYVAPEYGMGAEISARGDVYSFGVLLLEMFTGKRPTNEMFTQGQSLHELAKMSLPTKVMDVVDPRLLEAGESGRESPAATGSKLEECLISVIKIGVLCSVQSPRERPVMKDVTPILVALRETHSAMLGNHRRHTKFGEKRESPHHPMISTKI